MKRARRIAGHFRLALLGAVLAAGCIDPASRPTSWWIEQLREEDPDDRRAAREQLVSRGAAAVPDLIPLLSAEDLVVAMSAADCLGTIGPASVPALIDALRTGPARGRGWAIHALKQIGAGARDALPALQDASRDPALRMSATLAIREISGN